MKEDVKFSTQDSMKEVNDEIKKMIGDNILILVTIMAVCSQEIPCAAREGKEAM